jgi:alpha-tubulin suppressor-like RCC1 family protein
MRRSARLSAPLLAVTVVASVAAGISPALASGTRASQITVSATPSTELAGGTFVVAGTARPVDTSLGLTVLRLENGHWRTVGHAHESRIGSFSLPLKAPTTTGLMSVRVVRAAGKSVAAGVSRTFAVHVVGKRFSVHATSAPTVVNPAPITVRGTVSPRATGVVSLQRLQAARWNTIATVAIHGSSYSLATVRPIGSYELRVVKPATTTLAAGASKSFSVTVTGVPVNQPLPPTPIVTTAALPAGSTRLPYSVTLTSAHAAAPVSWTVSAGNLPPGLTLNTAGAISGIPDHAGISDFTVTLADGQGLGASAALSISVAASGGTLASWGSNSNGQLGDGLAETATAPHPQAGLEGIVQVASFAGDTNYALTEGGGVLSWGVGDKGQLGDGTTVGDSTPGPVTGLSSGVTAIAAGQFSAYALKADGTVWAWGFGADGQLGDGSGTDHAVPIQIPGLTSVVAIAGDGLAAMALKADGTVWRFGLLWEFNGGQDVGDSSTTPVEVAGLGGRAIAITGGQNTSYALMADHTVRAWGAGYRGELGNGIAEASSVPVTVTHMSGVTAIAAGGADGYALTADGSVWAWGEGLDGELGNGTTGSDVSDSLTPVQVSDVTDAVAISGAARSAYAVLGDHTVRSWGHNFNAELGNGGVTDSPTPTTVLGLSSVTQVAGTGLALNSDGTVWSWGVQHLAYLDRTAVGPVVGLDDIIGVAADPDGDLAVRSDGTVWAWGSNRLNHLGNSGLTSYRSDLPLQVPGLTGVVAVASDLDASFAVKADGTVWGWGFNYSGILGDTTAYTSDPTQLPGPSGVIAIAAGAADVYALAADGTVWAWGDNTLGELGNGTTVTSTTPVRIDGLPRITQVAAGLRSAFALSADGRVWAWGENDQGQLGDGSTQNVHSPEQLVGVAGASSLSTDGDVGCASLTDGSVLGWGVMTIGQPGAAPAPVAGFSAIKSMAGGECGYAVRTDGSVLSRGRGLVSGLSGVTALAAADDHAVALVAPVHP